jgi:tellurite resistance protein TehA-like permease
MLIGEPVGHQALIDHQRTGAGNARIAQLPVPLYGAALGVLGLSLLLPGTWPSQGAQALATSLRWLGLALLMGALLARAAKLAWAGKAWRHDMANPAAAPFVGQIGVALSLLCEGWRASQGDTEAALASICFMASSLVALATLGHALWLWLSHRPGWRDASPAWLLPAIQWLYLGALAPHQAPSVTRAMLAVGALLGALACLCLLLRALRGPAWPAPAQPALAIVVALPAVLALIALAPEGQTAGSTAGLTALALTLLSYGAALWRLPYVLAQPFRISWWAYGMPLSAAAMAFNAAVAQASLPSWLGAVAQGASALSTLITLVLLACSGRAVYRFVFSPAYP